LPVRNDVERTLSENISDSGMKYTLGIL